MITTFSVNTRPKCKKGEEILRPIISGNINLFLAHKQLKEKIPITCNFTVCFSLFTRSSSSYFNSKQQKRCILSFHYWPSTEVTISDILPIYNKLFPLISFPRFKLGAQHGPEKQIPGISIVCLRTTSFFILSISFFYLERKIVKKAGIMHNLFFFKTSVISGFYLMQASSNFCAWGWGRNDKWFLPRPLLLH